MEQPRLHGQKRLKANNSPTSSSESERDEDNRRKIQAITQKVRQQWLGGGKASALTHFQKKRYNVSKKVPTTSLAMP